MLDWVISDAPDFSEPEAPLPPPPVTVSPVSLPRLRLSFSHRSRFILLASLLSLSLVLSLCPSLGQLIIRGQLAQIVQLEDRLALAGENVQLESLSDAVWLKRQQTLTAPGDLVPRPLPMLTPLREPGRLQAWNWVASDLARVEVVRQFTAPDGQVYAFVIPQYYQYANSAWKRVAPPQAESRSTFRGHYVEVTYASAEADLVADELAPYLDTILARACAVWVCPEGFRIGVTFGAQPRTFFPNAPLPDDPLLFSQTPIVFNRSPRNTLALPAPSVVGYPVGDQAVELFKRAVTAQALLVVADGVLFAEGERDLARNAFLYALVARLGAQLDLEAPTVYHILTSPLTRTPNVLWDIGIGGTSRSGDEMRRALAMLNWILRERPAESELALFDALREADNPVQWLSLGLGLTPEDAQTAWDEAEIETFDVNMGYRVLAPPDLAYAAALGCRAGPALLMNDDTVFRPLPDYGARASAIAIAPGGARVAVSLADQPAVIDFTTQRVYALPNATPGNLIRLTWLDETRVAYVMYPSFWSHEFTMSFFDATAPNQPARTLLNILDYALSPDHRRAAVVSAQSITALGPALQGTLGLMPTEGGPLTALDTGASPTWSPDGTQLAYLHGESLPGDTNQHQFELRLAEVSTGLTRTLYSFTLLGPHNPTPFSSPIWSPDGKQVALTASHGDDLYLLVVALDGRYQKFTLGPNEYYATQLNFVTADGLIAITRLGDRPDVSTLLYRISPSVAEFPPYEGAAYWASTGHAWLWAEPNRTSRMDSLILNNARPLLNDECDAVWFQPDALRVNR